MLTRRARLRRLAASLTAMFACATLASALASPVAHAADGREMLAGAIAPPRAPIWSTTSGPDTPRRCWMRAARWYEMNNGGHLMIIKNASSRLSPHLLVDTHRGDQARCESNPGARTGEGSDAGLRTLYAAEAWQRMGQPTIAINANFFDVRGQKAGSWRSTGCSSPLGAFIDNTNGQGRANAGGHRAPWPTPASRGSRAAARAGRR